MTEAVRQILGGQARIGRPIGVDGLTQSAQSPAFAAAVGLLVYPQVAGHEYFEPRREYRAATGTDNYVMRVSRWLRESF
jgi:cell division protein FtsA